MHKLISTSKDCEGDNLTDTRIIGCKLASRLCAEDAVKEASLFGCETADVGLVQPSGNNGS